jgi:hypothetical protein
MNVLHFPSKKMNACTLLKTGADPTTIEFTATTPAL